MADTPSPASGGGRKNRPPPKRAIVEAVTRLSPLLTRITFTGEELAQFTPPRPAAHIKLLFAPEGSDWSPDDKEAPRPPSRTYTPLRYDHDNRRLEVEFVHHGDGLAATWATQAKAGDNIFIGGPGGGYDIPPDMADIVLVADDTALPAASMILDTLPEQCRATILGEVTNADEERPIQSRAETRAQWHHRTGKDSADAVLLENAVRNLDDIPKTAAWWIACEAGAMRRIRDFLLKEQGIDPKLVHTRGYWRRGAANYPDHDYGKD